MQQTDQPQVTYLKARQHASRLFINKKYIEERKDKADKQTDDEANGITYAKQTKSDWDELVSYRYAIL